MSFVSTFVDSSEHYPSLIEKGEQYAVQFNALVPFNAYHYICPRMSAHNGILHLSLYRWNRTYNNTVSGVAIATTVCDLADGTTMQFNFDEQQPGEYLLVAHDGTAGWLRVTDGKTQSLYNPTYYENIGEVIHGLSHAG